MRRVLIVDNNLHTPCYRCSRFTYGMGAEEITVIRPVDENLPSNITRFTHVVLSGSMGQISEQDALFKKLKPFIKKVAKAKIPLLGVCYGHQAIIGTFSDTANVKMSRQPEIGWVWVQRLNRAKSRLFIGLPRRFWAAANHTHEARSIPEGFTITARTKRCPIAAIEHESLPIFGVQFHPEVGPYHLHKAIAYWRRHKVNPNWFTDQAYNDQHFSPKLERKIFRNFYKT